MDELIRTIENDNNISVLNETFQSIKKSKENTLKSIEIHGKLLHEYLKKLKHYRYIENIDQVRLGVFVRWIDLYDERLLLKNGGTICNIDYNNDDDDDVNIRIMCNLRNYKKIFYYSISKMFIISKNYRPRRPSFTYFTTYLINTISYHYIHLVI